jgi:hypothetical protein
MPELAFGTTCAVCRRQWLADKERWRAYHVGEDSNEPAELVFYCLECSEREFGSNPIA